MSVALVLKLTLAPGLIAVATLAARRFGPAAAGWWASTPVVAAPVLLVFALEHGDRFGAESARAATLGLVSLSAFTCVYALLAGRGMRWPLCLAAGYCAFAAGTAVLSQVVLPALASLAVAVTAAVVAREPLRRATSAPQTSPRGLPGDLAVRMAAGLGMVLVLGAVAGALGPRTSGLLAPFPVIGSVMAVFTHVTAGRGAVAPYADALLRGMPSFAVALAIVALALVPLGLAASFALCALATAIAHGALIGLAHRSGRGTPAPEPSGSLA